MIFGRLRNYLRMDLIENGIPRVKNPYLYAYLIMNLRRKVENLVFFLNLPILFNGGLVERELREK